MKYGSLIHTKDEEIEYLKDEIEQLKVDLRGKYNEVEVLKSRIEYLKQFKPLYKASLPTNKNK